MDNFVEDAQTFKAGDVVQLKSSYLKMTVSYISSDITHKDEPVLCVWFNGCDLNRGWFSAASLKMAPSDEDKYFPKKAVSGEIRNG